MEMKNPHVIWAAVVIVFILVASAVTLVALDKDVTVILSLAGLVAVPVLSAFGVAVYHKLDQVKDASNGNLTKLMDMQQQTQAELMKLALLMPQQAMDASVIQTQADSTLTTQAPSTIGHTTTVTTTSTSP